MTPSPKCPSFHVQTVVPLRRLGNNTGKTRGSCSLTMEGTNTTARTDHGCTHRSTRQRVADYINTLLSLPTPNFPAPSWERSRGTWRLTIMIRFVLQSMVSSPPSTIHAGASAHPLHQGKTASKGEAVGDVLLCPSSFQNPFSVGEDVGDIPS